MTARRGQAKESVVANAGFPEDVSSVADSGANLIPQPCSQSQPSGSTSLLDLYGLRDFANSVARQDPVTGAKRKLRKSYKNHIADLPGKHPIPGPGESEWTLLDTTLRNPLADTKDCLRSLEFSDSMLKSLKFQKGPSNQLVNFDPKLLAAPGLGSQSNPATPLAATPLGGSTNTEDTRSDKRKRKDQILIEKRRKL